MQPRPRHHPVDQPPRARRPPRLALVDQHIHRQPARHASLARANAPPVRHPSPLAPRLPAQHHASCPHSHHPAAKPLPRQPPALSRATHSSFRAARIAFGSRRRSNTRKTVTSVCVGSNVTRSPSPATSQRTPWPRRSPRLLGVLRDTRPNRSSSPPLRLRILTPYKLPTTNYDSPI